MSLVRLCLLMLLALAALYLFCIRLLVTGRGMRQ